MVTGLCHFLLLIQSLRHFYLILAYSNVLTFLIQNDDPKALASLQIIIIFLKISWFLKKKVSYLIHLIYRCISNHHILCFNYLTMLYPSYLSKVKQKWVSYQHLRTIWSFPGGSDGKESACNAGDPGSIPGSAKSLEKGMATNSSILAWRILWTEEPGWL